MLFLYSRQMATSTIQLTDELKSILRETSQKLKGSERRQFMAKNEMNYRLRRVVKVKPQKRCDPAPPTGARERAPRRKYQKLMPFLTR